MQADASHGHDQDDDSSDGACYQMTPENELAKYLHPERITFLDISFLASGIPRRRLTSILESGSQPTRTARKGEQVVMFVLLSALLQYFLFRGSDVCLKTDLF
jgi:hypothetical protein